jgi:hypothetical protein
LKGTDVYVNDKCVGKVKHHPEEGKGLEFHPEEGEKHHFAKLGDLYTHLNTKFKLKESEEEHWALYCGKKGDKELKFVSCGTKEECESKKDSEEHKDCVHKIVKVKGEKEAPKTISESVKDYESDIQKLKNRPEFNKLKAFVTPGADKEGLDADGDHDGTQDGKQADDKRQAPIKKLIKDIDGGKRVTKD